MGAPMNERLWWYNSDRSKVQRPKNQQIFDYFSSFYSIEENDEMQGQENMGRKYLNDNKNFSRVGEES